MWSAGRGVEGWGSTPPTAQFASHTDRCSLADIRDFKKRPESSIGASRRFMEVVRSSTVPVTER